MDKLQLTSSAVIVSTFLIASLAAPLTDVSCDATADVIFLADTSYSIEEEDFNVHVKTFINDFVGYFNIGPGKQDTRVGLVLFSGSVHSQFYLNSWTTKEEVQRAVRGSHFRGGRTYTHMALEYTHDVMLSPNNGARPGVPKVVVVLTDGESNDQRNTKIEAKKIKDMGVDVFSIGVGSQLDREELRDIASSPADRYVFNVTDFDALSTIKREFAQTTCVVLTTTSTTLPPTTTEISFDIDEV